MKYDETKGETGFMWLHAPDEPGIVTSRTWNGPLDSSTDRGEA